MSNCLRWGAIGAGGDQHRAGAGQATNAVAARGLEGFGDAQRRQHGGEPPRYPRRAYPDGTRAEVAWGARPAEASPSFPDPEGRLTRAAGLLLARMSADAFSIERTPMGWADASHAAALVLAALVVSI